MASRQVVFRPEAVDDVLEVKAWYDSRRAGLGQEFGQVLDDLVERIASNPDMFRRVHVAITFPVRCSTSGLPTTMSSF